MKRYELTAETKVWSGRTLHRIRALVAFGNVKAGELGGWIEKESNLEQYGNAWVYDNALVYDNARVCGNARVYDNALVYGNAWVRGNARVCGDAWVYGNAWIYGDAYIEKITHCLTIGAIGSRNDVTTFFRTKDKTIFVRCGCFFGSIDDFVKAVKKTHGGTKHEKTYMLAVELAKTQIEDVENGEMENGK